MRIIFLKKKGSMRIKYLMKLNLKKFKNVKKRRLKQNFFKINKLLTNSKEKNMKWNKNIMI